MTRIDLWKVISLVSNMGNRTSLVEFLYVIGKK